MISFFYKLQKKIVLPIFLLDRTNICLLWLGFNLAPIFIVRSDASARKNPKTFLIELFRLNLLKILGLMSII